MSDIVTFGLSLDPLDVLFFRDGRPFEAGIRATSTVPLPQTLSGALRTHVLTAADCDFAKLGEAVRGAVPFAEALARQNLPSGLASLVCRGPWFTQRGNPVLPMPASLHRAGNKATAGSFVRLAPLDHAPPGWRAELPRPLWTFEPGRTERATGWLTLPGMTAFLNGGKVEPSHAVRSSDLFETDSRTGIVIGAETWTAEEQLIYAADYLALKDCVSLYAEITGPRPALESAFPSARPVTLPLGGQGRRVAVTRRPQPAAWPAMRLCRSQRRLLVLTTPAPFAKGWRPETLSPVAAAVPGYVAFSGWDLAQNGPKPTRFAAAAGSVLFFDTPPQPTGTSLCDAAEDGQLGWGSFLQGTW